MLQFFQFLDFHDIHDADEFQNEWYLSRSRYIFGKQFYEDGVSSFHLKLLTDRQTENSQTPVKT